MVWHVWLASLLALVVCFAAGCSSKPLEEEVFGSKQRRIREFWTWFQEHRREIERVSPAGMSFVNELARNVKRIDSGLIWEVHPAAKGLPFTFTVGAEGDTDLFDTVLDVVEAAPQIPSWRIQAFRQPDARAGKMQYKSAEVSLKDVKFTTAPAGERLLLNYYVRGWRPGSSDDIEGAVILLVDTVIGEFESVAKVENVRFASLADAPAHARQIEELPKAIANVEGPASFVPWRERMLRLNGR